MNTIKQNQLSIFLMASSLLLLLFFLLFWLKSEYEDQHAVLLKETDYLLIQAIRKAEDELINGLVDQKQQHHQLSQQRLITQFIPSKVLSNVDSFGGTSQENLTTSFINDSTQIVSIVKSKYFTYSERDSQHQVTIHSNLSQTENSETKGLISLIIDTDGTEDSATKIWWAQHDQDSTLIQLIDTHFAPTLAAHNIQLDYSILPLAERQPTKDAFQSNNQHEFLSGQKFFVEFPEYRSHVLAQLWPQLLFSLLLFSCIALAFFVVHQSLQKQQKLTALKNDFISNVTHELKTPITTVGVAIEAMRNFNALQNPERTQEYLDISKHELNRLSILVDKVLKMSAFEKGQTELKIETLDLRTLTQEILNSLKLQFERLAAQVDFQAQGQNFLIQGDRLHLTSVLYNLIDNALKYSPERPQIRIGLSHQAAGLQITVSDQGVGIAPEYQHKVFDQFFRIPTGNEHNIKGHGLGLSYVASVIRKHQGSIALKSRPGNGSTFTIVLPSTQEA
ncbi:MAG: HAMP domain-containing sensor histidine kinase [Bacteroidota bacterium]